MQIPLELILTVTLSALGGAIIPAVGLWLQSNQSKRQLSLRHEEVVYKRRLDLALEVSRTCYKYMAVSHKLRNETDNGLKQKYQLDLFEIGKQIESHESEVVVLFPEHSVAAFRKYWRTVDQIRTAQHIHWTEVSSLLDDTYAELTNAMRSDLGVDCVENRLIQAFGYDT